MIDLTVTPHAVITGLFMACCPMRLGPRAWRVD